MDYEKLYKEALERASKYYNANTNKCYRKIFEDIFHEFKESEDEKIRKALLEHFGTYHSGSAITNDVVVEDVLAWLEKQGEQNTIVNESPSKEMILAVWELGDIWKELTKGSSCTEYGTQLQYIQKHWKESVYYEKLQGKQKPIIIIPQFKVGDIIKPKPYNEEHLIKDINENGYVLDVDIIIPFKDEDVWEIVEQKTAWSEEDDYVYNEILKRVADKKLYEHDLEYIYTWLKSLKPNHWKPSDQNIKDLEWCADLVKDKMGVGFYRLQVFIDDIKNL